jgi:hypothetical protein
VQEQSEGLILGAIAVVRGVDASPLLDRLIRGRAWIGIVAFALIGIVTLQLLLLKLNAGIGRALVQETTLTRENAALNIEDSERASGDVVESSAADLGMELVPSGSLRFLTATRPSPTAEHAAARALTATISTPVTTSTGGEATSSSTATSEGTGAAAETSSTTGSSTVSGQSTGSTGESSTAPGVGAAAGESSATGTSAPADTQGATPGETHTAETSAGATAVAPQGGASGAGSAPTTETRATPAGGTQAQSGGAG